MLLRTALDEERAKELVREKLRELNMDYFTLTRVAHCALYGTTPDLNQGHINWVQHGIVEPHVKLYLERL